MNAVIIKKGILAATVIIASSYAAQTVRVKEVAVFNGIEDIQLFGYGLVVGLDGTGDRSQTIFTAQTITNMLKNMGIELPKGNMRIRNVAAVMVTGTLNPFKPKGTRLDVAVSSLGDASSLEGGTLILTPLQGPDQVVYASAQGPIATGGYDVRNRGMTHIKKNHVLVGRIPDGAIVQQEYELNTLDRQDVSLSLINPDFTSAVKMAEAINEEFRNRISRTTTVAEAKDAGTIELFYHVVARDSVRQYIPLIQFMSMVENVSFQIESAAKVVVNERTGTIVAGGNVKISEVAVTHGGIKIEVVNLPEVIQPQPFSIGQTEIIPNPEMVVEETDAQMVVLPNSATVTDLAQSLNSLGVSPRDVIAIFQAIKQAGALHGKLEIM